MLSPKIELDGKLMFASVPEVKTVECCASCTRVGLGSLQLDSMSFFENI